MLKNRVALITGGAGGIGQAIANEFAKNGAKIIIADWQLDAAEKTAAQINQQGGEAYAVQMDVSQEASVNSAVEMAIKKFGLIDLLVSNAGVQHIAPVHELSFADWRRVLAINLDGAFLVTRACLPHMYAHKRGGHIIYIGSVHSKLASVLKAPYVTAKHGLLGLCRVVAKEGAPYHVRANVISPGFVKTPLVEKQIPEQAKNLGISEDEVVKKIMLGQTVSGEFTTLMDIANTAVFLAAQSTEVLTGQSINLNHGWWME